MSRPTDAVFLAIALGACTLPACAAGLQLEVGALKAKMDEHERVLDALRRRAEQAHDDRERCRARVSELERDFSKLKGRLDAGARASDEGGAGSSRAGKPPGAGQERPHGEARAATGGEPGALAECPRDLPEAVRKIRQGMKAEEARRRLAGVHVQQSETLTLTGSGERKATRIVGPCFRLRLEGGRVSEVELEGGPARRGR